MIYSLSEIAATIKEARKKKGLSQRALSAKVGVPQSHISKIENGVVDLQTSSLIELARALDLELMLVPRPLAPTFRALQRDSNNNGPASTPAYRLDEEQDDNNG